MSSNADRKRLEPAAEARSLDLRRIVYVQLAPSENPVLMEFPGSVPIRTWLGDVPSAAGQPIPGGASGAGFRLEADDGRRMNPARSLADNGIGNGATLVLRSVEKGEAAGGDEDPAPIVTLEKEGESGLSHDDEINPSPVTGASLFHASGLVIELDPLPAVIGRASRTFRPEIDLSDLDRRKVVSRNHARLEKRDGAYLLRTGTTTNGTFVNGAEIKSGTERILSDGDRLLFGYDGVELIFRRPGNG